MPIVNVCDPDTKVACDMNVNNPIALENTRLIRSYVAIDERFRPLAMIIKHWAKRRMLNDAGRSTCALNAGTKTDMPNSAWWNSQLIHVDMLSP